MSNVYVCKQHVDGCVSHVCINHDDLVVYSMQGYVRYSKPITTTTYTCIPPLTMNTVRLNAMTMYVHMLRTNDVIDLDMLASIPTFIFN